MKQLALFILIMLTSLYFINEINSDILSIIATVILYSTMIYLIQKDDLNVFFNLDYKFTEQTLPKTLIVFTCAIGLILINLFFVIVVYIEILGNTLPTIKEKEVSILVISGLFIFSIIEELLFRKALIDYLKGKYSTTKSLMFSSLLFAIMHIFTDSSLLITFIAGLVFGYVYLKFNNVLFSILTHLIVNFSILFFSTNIIKYGILLNDIGTPFYLFFITGVLFLLIFKRLVDKYGNGSD